MSINPNDSPVDLNRNVVPTTNAVPDVLDVPYVLGTDGDGGPTVVPLIMPINVPVVVPVVPAAEDYMQHPLVVASVTQTNIELTKAKEDLEKLQKRLTKASAVNLEPRQANFTLNKSIVKACKARVRDAEIDVKHQLGHICHLEEKIYPKVVSYANVFPAMIKWSKDWSTVKQCKGIGSVTTYGWQHGLVSPSVACLMQGEKEWVELLNPNAAHHKLDQILRIRTSLAKLGMRFLHVSKDFVNKPGGGGNKAILNKRKGKYILQVAINYPAGDERRVDDPDPIRPFLSWDGNVVRDHNVSGVAHEVTDADRKTEDTARAVFRGIYKGCKVTLENVYLIK